jgi:preprotein translocase subunit SecG
VVAVLFMLSSFFLTYMTTRTKSVVSDVNIPVQTQPLQQPAGEPLQQK